MDCPQIKYPIYIVSKGRWDRPLTARIFLKENIPFRIAVEPQEYDQYCQTIPPEFVAKLPFSNLGMGSYPARNWCWEDSILKGHAKHFIFDDNIYRFLRLNEGKRTHIDARTALNVMEKFTDKFAKLAIAGFNYSSFVNKATPKPFYINVHAYSGMLINNEIPFRWRLRYNEDVDICLQALHAGWNTILLNTMTIAKVSTTAKMKGGNQTELYQNNDHGKKMLKSKSLEMMWPQYVKVVTRFGRPHHYVNWLQHFKHPLLRKKSDTALPNSPARELEIPT